MCEQIAQKAKRTGAKPVTTRSQVVRLHHDSVQAQRHDVELPAWSDPAVLAPFLQISLRRRIMATSLITPVCTVLMAMNILPTGFLRGWPVGV